MKLQQSVHLAVRAGDGIRRRPWLHALSLFTLAAAFLSFAATLTAAINLDALLTKWAGSGELTVYLSENANQSDLAHLSAAVSRLDSVARVDPVTPETARSRFARDIGKLGEMARTLPAAAFPYSIDVYLRSPESRSIEARRALAARLEKVEMVQEVELYDDWFERLSAITLVGRISAWGLGLIALVVAILVVTAVVRAGIGSRSREIEVLRLVGATERYVRLPFLIEGAAEATLAMIVALVSLHFLTDFADQLAGDLFAILGAATLVRPSWPILVALLLGSAAAGLAGARISLKGLSRV